MNLLPIIAVAFFSADLFTTILSVIGWTVVGVGLLAGGMKLFDWATPGKLHDQVFVEGKTAPAIVYGAALIAIALIVASAMH